MIQVMSKKKQHQKKSKKNSLIKNDSNSRSPLQKSSIQNILRHSEIKRLNCEIPKELHTWLNLYARSNHSEYKSMTAIVINLLGNFAIERGFKSENSGCRCE